MLVQKGGLASLSFHDQQFFARCWAPQRLPRQRSLKLGLLQGSGKETSLPVHLELAARAVACSYRTEDGTAIAGIDYEEATGTLEFADQEAGFRFDVCPKYYAAFRFPLLPCRRKQRSISPSSQEAGLVERRWHDVGGGHRESCGTCCFGQRCLCRFCFKLSDNVSHLQILPVPTRAFMPICVAFLKDGSITVPGLFLDCFLSCSCGCEVALIRRPSSGYTSKKRRAPNRREHCPHRYRSAKRT